MTMSDAPAPIVGEHHRALFDPAQGVARIEGSFRLNGLEEYRPLMQALLQLCEQCDQVTLDLRALDFLNSSGIAMLSKFALEMRARDALKLSILASDSIPWQGKSLKNIQRLLPTLELRFE